MYRLLKSVNKSVNKTVNIYKVGGLEALNTLRCMYWSGMREPK